MFTKMTGADYACIGEGEVTICELMDSIVAGSGVEGCAGIVYKNGDGEYIENTERAPITDLDSIPFPDYDGLELEKYLESQTPYDEYYTYADDYPRMLPIYLGRSCPFLCTFCYHPLGNKYRQRSLDNFFLELDQVLKKYQVNELGIFDELFSLNKENVERFCERISEYNLRWHIQLRVNIADKPLLMMMKKAGCTSISYGIESYNRDVLASMKKKISQEEIARALQDTYECGITIQGNFIFGDEEETVESFKETLGWWREHRKYMLNLAFIETYPGTALYKNAVKSGLIPDCEKFITDGCPIINMTKLTDAQFSTMRTIVALEEFKDCGYNGEVLRIAANETEDKMVDATLRCAHCGQVSTYRRVEKKRVYSNHFKMCCRHCGQKSVFDTRAYFGIRDSEFKYKMYYYILKQYLQNIREGLNPGDGLDMGAIALFYESEFGDDFVHILRGYGKLMYIIAPGGSRVQESAAGNIKVVGMESMEEQELETPTDATIVLDIMNYKRIEEELRQKGYNGRIVPVDDVLFGMVV